MLPTHSLLVRLAESNPELLALAQHDLELVEGTDHSMRSLLQQSGIFPAPGPQLHNASHRDGPVVNGVSVIELVLSTTDEVHQHGLTPALGHPQNIGVCLSRIPKSEPPAVVDPTCSSLSSPASYWLASPPHFPLLHASLILVCRVQNVSAYLASSLLATLFNCHTSQR